MAAVKILIAECKQEVSTFNPVSSGYEDFTMRHGRVIFDDHQSARSKVGGALSVFDEALRIANLF